MTTRSGARPRTKLPAHATDCHHHLYDARYPAAPNAALRPGDATVADYRALQQRIGTSRSVIVQPSTYGIGIRLLMESIAMLGLETRGIAVVNPSVTDAELKRLDEAGVRGIRFNLSPPGTTTLDMVQPLAQRIAPLGWHVQVNAPAAALLDAKAVWSDLPVPVVFDHLAHAPGTTHPVFAMILELLQRDKAWVKLSGLYLDSKVGPPTYADSVEVASAWASEAPQRTVWGSDWPHPTEQARGVPDDALLVDLFAQCVPDDAARQRILVENPARLYRFG